MQPALKNNLLSIWKEYINTTDSLSNYLVLYFGKTGTYEGFGKQTTDEKAHSFFKWAKNCELKFCLEDKTKLEFGQESTFITNFMAWFGWEHRGFCGLVSTKHSYFFD